MSDAKGPICELWTMEDAERQGGLNIARKCSELTDPATLPPINQSADQKLPETFQEIGALGLANMEGKFTSAIWPVDVPWVQLDLAPQTLYDSRIDDTRKEAVRKQLFLIQLQMLAMLESANISTTNRYSGMGFRSHKRNVINSILVTGEALEHIDDDYRFRMFRRDQYVTRRDSCGDVLYHAVKELKDPLTLSEDEIAKSGLNRTELQAMSPRDRMMDLYTKVEWGHSSKKWVIAQEINGRQINESDAEYSPYFCTPFRLVVGENYGRGYVEKLKPSLSTLNELELRRLDMLAAASRVNPCIDFASQVRDTDLQKPSGRVIRCRVVDGKPVDVGFLAYGNIREMGMLTAGIQEKHANLARAFLLETQSLPDKDRVTRAQVIRTAMELEGITGGFYTPVAESQQVPTTRRVLWQMRRDRLINVKLPSEAVRIEAYTGAAALSRAQRGNDMLEYTTIAAQLGPEALTRINTGVLLDLLARYRNLYEPGLIKSDEQVKKDQEEAMQLASRMAASQKAVDVTGNIIEANATQQ